MALSQQLFLLFVLSSCQTLTSASKASSFCLTVNRWNSEMHSPHLIPQLFFFYWQTICLGLQVSCWSVTSRTFGYNVSRMFCSERVPCKLFWIMREAAWCFFCVRSALSTRQSECLSRVHISYDSQYHFIISKISFYWRVTRVWMLEGYLLCLVSAFILWMFTSSHTGQRQVSFCCLEQHCLKSH